MRAAVKSFAIASAIAIVGMQPVADAALGPDVPANTVSNLANIALDEADALATAPYYAPRVILSGAVSVDFARPKAFEPSAWSISIPPIATVAPDLDHVMPKPMPELAAIEPTPAEPKLTPQIDIPLPSARPRMREMSRTAPIDQVKFEAAAGAPFAHVRFCLANPGECRERKVVFRGGPVKLTEAKRRELMRVNAEVNRDIIATEMNEPVAQEQWLISPQNGDCNDYAVTKRHKLIAKGWPARALLLAEVVVPTGDHHLVVLVRTDKGDLVLDNLNASVLGWSKTRYQWVRVESPANPKFWQKIAAPATEMASLRRKGSGRL